MNGIIKKYSAIIISLVMVVAVFSHLSTLENVNAETETAIEGEDIVSYPVTGGNLYFDRAIGAITDCDEGVTQAEIPSQIYGVEVSSIGRSAFINCTELKKVSLPKTLKSICEAAFADCSSLDSIVIPKGVINIADRAFSGCHLKTVELPNTLRTIGTQVFSGNREFTSIIIPDSVTSIGAACFSGCVNLETVKLSKNIKEIPPECFYVCEKLKDLEIPEGVTAIEGYAFFGCEALDIKLPNSVKTIDYAAFGRTNAKYIEIPDSVESLGMYTFKGCENLKFVKLSKNLTTIPNGCFHSCPRLENLRIPENVKKIEENAFFQCEGLKKVELPKSLNSIKSCYRNDGIISPYYNSAFAWSDKVRLYGYAGSYAESYARKYGIPFIYQKENPKLVSMSLTKVFGQKPFQLKVSYSGNGKLSYKSSDTKVAAVSSDGRVTLKGPGRATITITAAATASYNGATKRVTITVKPKKTAGLKVKKGKKRMTVSWKRDKKATGYQLTYAQNKKFKKGRKNITISKNKTTKKTVKKLKAKKTYYVKVRAYKSVGKTKLYGAYSGVKKVKTR